jgi:dienelactone hydrolase
MSDTTSTRRHFLAEAGMASLAALASGGESTPAAEPARAGPPPDRPRDLKPTGSELGSLFPDIEKLVEANRFSFALSGGRFRTFEEFKAAARDKVLELLLYRPEKVEPRPEVLERVDRDDHVREKVLFSTTPHFRVPAYVLIPKKRSGPAPAVVDLHSHGGMFLFGKEKVVDLGDNHPAMTAYQEHNYDGRPTATALVRRGYVVITIDAFFFGERRILLDADLSYGWDRSKYGPDAVAHLNQQCRGKEATLVKGLTLAGTTWPGIVFWDDVRTVDYLATRPEVDPKRIGCIGISMGGIRSFYLAALDDRIAAACVAGFMSSVKPMVKAHLDTHSWVHFLPGLHRWLDLPDVASLAAPRALLVQQCSQDRLFPPEGMKEAIDTIAAAFEKAGAAKQFSGRFYDVPHKFTRAMQDDAFAWLDRHLSPGAR